MNAAPPRVGAGSACPRARASFHDASGPAPAAAHVRAPRPGDALRLAEHLRPADRRELEALGEEPLAAIEAALAASVDAFAAIAADGRLIALFGVAPTEDPILGAPWMLATPALETAARPFLRACRGWVGRLGQRFPLLANRVDRRNAVHIRWLRWCGFQFLREVPLGPQRRPFLEFVRLTPGGAETSDPSHERTQPMCTLAAVGAALGAASSFGGMIQQQQQFRAQQQAARRQEALLRRQTINRYDEIALERQASRREASEKIRSSRDKALRAQERARTRAGEAGSAGLSLDALLRDLRGAEARFDEEVRAVHDQTEQRLRSAAVGDNLQFQQRFNRVRQPTPPDYLGLAQQGFGQLANLQQELKRV